MGDHSPAACFGKNSSPQISALEFFASMMQTCKSLSQIWGLGGGAGPQENRRSLAKRPLTDIWLVTEPGYVYACAWRCV